MGKKKYFDKKKSATFQLLARESSSATVDPEDDRVFVRVDNNPYSVKFGDQINESEKYDDDSIFADAPGDADDDGFLPPPWFAGAGSSIGGGGPSRGALPDSVRKEILELGLPDDGYNYLLHLREIRNTGGGSQYYENSKAKLETVKHDVKAYDASRLRINANVNGESIEDSNSIFNVASKTVGTKIQRAVDPDVARLLDDDDLSRFASDVEDLDEDFAIKANLPDEEDEDEEEEEMDEEDLKGKGKAHLYVNASMQEEDYRVVGSNAGIEMNENEKPRVRRLLDEQFDLLTLREYDSDDDDADYDDAEDVPLAAKLNAALKPRSIDQLDLEDKYRVPADYLHNHQGSSVNGELEGITDVLHKCVEYAEKYCNEDHDDGEVVIVEESSDESEVWDCETIVSTYSNLDNHPGTIQAPGKPKRRAPKSIPEDSVLKNNIIELRGRENLPVEFLPRNRRAVKKVKEVGSLDAEKQKGKPRSEESKEEKKERKAAVKEEKREARKAKKELKGLYKFEAQKAQKVAAVAGPSSMHLM